MRTWIGIALTASCGQMVQTPGSQAAPAIAPSSGPSLTQPPATAAAPVPDPMDGSVLASGSSEEVTTGGGSAGQPAGAGRGAPRASSEQAAWVEAHNRARAKHCARPLSWSAKLAQVAQRWANSLRDRGCQFGHSGGSYGENLAAGTTGTLDPDSVVKMWYDEVAQYRFPDGGFSMKTGHFTQVVWRGTTAVR